MNCKVHGERSGINTCSKCGDWLCSECSVEVDGRVICKSCVTNAVRGGGYRRADEASPRRHVNWGLLLFFSFIFPGIGYMFMGLIKRGLFAMSGAFLCIYLISVTSSPLFAFALCILWVTNVFDGFQIRRKLNSGVAVADSIDDIVCFLKRNKTTVFFGSIVLLALSLFHGFANGIENFLWAYTNGAGGYYIRQAISSIVPLLILAFGIAALLKMRKTGKKTEKDDSYGDRN